MPPGREECRSSWPANAQSLSSTPTSARRSSRGSAPEVIVHGQTGIIVDDPAELADGIAQARHIDPAVCRKHVETGFAVDVMAAGYETVYRRTLGAVPGVGRAESS